ncbi:unnamed protein product [Paramecium pentaurelia]|uniref:Uncharacterized protein n=1 Tax=Paramecium pentaurelia TaxID=43138 RepID=A0A8S1TK34_9CILI|nr:unnamed protein product [Paramecium pentaurelia]
MQQISTKEGKYLYGLYVLCQGNIISSSQKGYLKDLLIQKDQQILEIVNEFNKEECLQELQTKLQEILIDLSSESQSLAGNTPIHQQWCYRSQDNNIWVLNQLGIKESQMRYSYKFLETQTSSQKRDTPREELEDQFQ